MTAVKIFDKYASALIDLGMGEDAPISPDAILLALRLAIGDAYAAGVDSVILNALDRLPPQKDGDQRQQESLQAQITRLNQAIADRDDQSDHLIRNAKNMTLLLEERDRTILRLQAEIDRLTRQNVIAVDTFNSLSAERTNGASAGSATGANPTPAAQSQDWGRSHPAWYGLSDDQRVTLYQLTKGELTFRQISRKERIEVDGMFGHIGSFRDYGLKLTPDCPYTAAGRQ